MKEWLYKVVSGTSAKHLRHIGVYYIRIIHGNDTVIKKIAIQ